MSNCSAPISKNQKKLLKILTCLFNQYVFCHTPATKSFMADPSNLSLASNMATELNGILGSINASPYFKSLSTVNVLAFARIVVYGADGVLSFDSAQGENPLSTFNFGTLKGTQMLNTNECQNVVYQIKPATYTNPASSMFGQVITEASAYERIGCAGVSNTGFLRLSVEVDIECYPFNPCQCTSCNVCPSTTSTSTSTSSCNTSTSSSSSTCAPTPAPTPVPSCPLTKKNKCKCKSKSKCKCKSKANK